MQRVAIYMRTLEGGGAQRSMVALANGFAARGYPTDFVLANAQGPFLGEVATGVRVVDLHAPRVMLSVPGFVRYLRRERPGAILSAVTNANIAAVVARAASRVPARLVISERNTLTRTMKHSSAVQAALIPRLMKVSYHRADAVVAVSSGVALDLVSAIGLPASKVSVIYNPVVGSDLRRKALEELHDPWIARSTSPVILAAGRFTPQKDYDALFEAFLRVRAARPARLVILGEGADRLNVEKRAQKAGVAADVLLPGFVSNPFAWMRRASVFVLSSRWEGLPGVLIQAMACGTPVVSTDCPSGPDEILEGGKWGRLVPVGNPAALAAAIASTLDEDVHPDVALRAKDFGEDEAISAYMKVLGMDA